MLLEERSLSASASSLSSRLLDGAGLRRRLFEDDDSPSSADSSHLASRAACLAALSSSSPRRGEEEDKEAGDSLRCDGDDFDLPSPISFGEQSARTSRDSASPPKRRCLHKDDEVSIVFTPDSAEGQSLYSSSPCIFDAEWVKKMSLTVPTPFKDMNNISTSELWPEIKSSYNFLMGNSFLTESQNDLDRSSRSRRSTDPTSLLSLTLSLSDFQCRYSDLQERLISLEKSLEARRISIGGSICHSEKYLFQNRKEELELLVVDFSELALKGEKVLSSDNMLSTSDASEWRERLATTDDRMKVVKVTVADMETSYDVDKDRKMMFKDLKEDLYNLDLWLDKIEGQMSSLILQKHWTTVDIKHSIYQNQVFQRDIEGKLRFVSSVQKLLDRLRQSASSPPGDEFEHLDYHLASLESRWHTTWLSSLEWRYRLEEAMLQGVKDNNNKALSPIYHSETEEAMERHDSLDVIPFNESEYEQFSHSEFITPAKGGRPLALSSSGDRMTSTVLDQQCVSDHDSALGNSSLGKSGSGSSSSDPCLSLEVKRGVSVSGRSHVEATPRADSSIGYSSENIVDPSSSRQRRRYIRSLIAKATSLVQRTPYSPSSTCSLNHGTITSQQRHLLALLADASAAFVLTPHSEAEDQCVPGIGSSATVLVQSEDAGDEEESDFSAGCSPKLKRNSEKARSHDTCHISKIRKSLRKKSKKRSSTTLSKPFYVADYTTDERGDEYEDNNHKVTLESEHDASWDTFQPPPYLNMSSDQSEHLLDDPTGQDWTNVLNCDSDYAIAIGTSMLTSDLDSEYSGANYRTIEAPRLASSALLDDDQTDTDDLMTSDLPESESDAEHEKLRGDLRDLYTESKTMLDNVQCLLAVNRGAGVMQLGIYMNSDEYENPHTSCQSNITMLDRIIDEMSNEFSSADVASFEELQNEWRDELVVCESRIRQSDDLSALYRNYTKVGMTLKKAGDELPSEDAISWSRYTGVEQLKLDQSSIEVALDALKDEHSDLQDVAEDLMAFSKRECSSGIDVSPFAEHIHDTDKAFLTMIRSWTSRKEEIAALKKGWYDAEARLNAVRNAVLHHRDVLSSASASGADSIDALQAIQSEIKNVKDMFPEYFTSMENIDGDLQSMSKFAEVKAELGEFIKHTSSVNVAVSKKLSVKIQTRKRNQRIMSIMKYALPLFGIFTMIFLFGLDMDLPIWRGFDLRHINGPPPS